jgi:hypothetical protein
MLLAGWNEELLATNPTISTTVTTPQAHARKTSWQSMQSARVGHE